MNVFIVDDSEPLRERLALAAAEIEGVTLVGLAGDARDAIESIRRLRPHVVLLDIRLSGGSGIYVLETIKHELPATSVLMFTAYATPQYRDRCLSAGADHFVDKNTGFARLIQILPRLARPAVSESLVAASASKSS